MLERNVSNVARCDYWVRTDLGDGRHRQDRCQLFGSYRSAEETGDSWARYLCDTHTEELKVTHRIWALMGIVNAGKS